MPPAITLRPTAHLHRRLEQYGRDWPAEMATVDRCIRLLHEADDVFVRARLAGHFTGSAWLVDRSGTSVLLTHHRKLRRWLQLGGHADGERDLALVALREAEEESGLPGLVVEAEVFDLDCHWIPERGDEPGHWHHDVRHVVRTSTTEEFVIGGESLDLAWRAIASIHDDPAADASLRRMARKWLLRSGA